MQLCYDPTTDRLELTVPLHSAAAAADDEPVAVATIPCILDVGDEGRLLGLELSLRTVSAPLRALIPGDDIYLEIENAPDPRIVRSVTAPATLMWSPASRQLVVRLPRRTDQYELLFPSGAT